MFMKITQKTHQKKYVFSIHFSMAPEGLAALAASDEDLDSRTRWRGWCRPQRGATRRGRVSGGWEGNISKNIARKIQKKIAAFWECS
jgi:hypothetical protein